MYILQAPNHIQGSLTPPASKSISNRALLLQALSKSSYAIENLSDCDDTQVMLQAFSAPEAPRVDIGAAGTSMRFLSAYYSITPGTRILTGTERMKNRPIRILVDALRSLGAQIEYTEKEGYPPLRITGSQLMGGSVVLNGGVSSQYLSALLMIAPCTQKGVAIQIEGELISEPYVAMTLSLMKEYGVQVQRQGDLLRVAPQTYSRSSSLRVESDWSAASYWYQIMALSPSASHLQLKGLLPHSYQGDAALVHLFRPLGVETEFTPEGVNLRKTASTTTFYRHDFVNEPDLAQALVVSCALLNIPFSFTGLQSLKIKETDRIVALQTELKKLGYALQVTHHSISWDGRTVERQAEPLIHTYEDHRMAMSFAPACISLGSIRIHEPGVVSKSYPHFWTDLEKVGFHIQEQ